MRAPAAHPAASQRCCEADPAAARVLLRRLGGGGRDRLLVGQHVGGVELDGRLIDRERLRGAGIGRAGAVLRRDGRAPGHRGRERLDDLRGDRGGDGLLRRVAVGALGRAEARDRGATRPAAGEVLVEFFEVGDGDAAIGALGEQAGTWAQVPRASAPAAFAAALRVALISWASGLKPVSRP